MAPLVGLRRPRLGFKESKPGVRGSSDKSDRPEQGPSTPPSPVSPSRNLLSVRPGSIASYFSRGTATPRASLDLEACMAPYVVTHLATYGALPRGLGIQELRRMPCIRGAELKKPDEMTQMMTDTEVLSLLVYMTGVWAKTPCHYCREKEKTCMYRKCVSLAPSDTYPSVLHGFGDMCANEIHSKPRLFFQTPRPMPTTPKTRTALPSSPLRRSMSISSVGSPVTSSPTPKMSTPKKKSPGMRISSLNSPIMSSSTMSSSTMSTPPQSSPDMGISSLNSPITSSLSSPSSPGMSTPKKKGPGMRISSLNSPIRIRSSSTMTSPRKIIRIPSLNSPITNSPSMSKSLAVAHGTKRPLDTSEAEPMESRKKSKANPAGMVISDDTDMSLDDDQAGNALSDTEDETPEIQKTTRQNISRHSQPADEDTVEGLEVEGVLKRIDQQTSQAVLAVTEECLTAGQNFKLPQHMVLFGRRLESGHAQQMEGDDKARICIVIQGLLKVSVKDVEREQSFRVLPRGTWLVVPGQTSEAMNIGYSTAVVYVLEIESKDQLDSASFMTLAPGGCWAWKRKGSTVRVCIVHQGKAHVSVGGQDEFNLGPAGVWTVLPGEAGRASCAGPTDATIRVLELALV